MPDPAPLRVLVLSCGPLGATVANRLAALDEVADVLLVTAPYRTRDRSPAQKLVRSLRYDGFFHTLRAAVGRLQRPGRSDGRQAGERETEGEGARGEEIEELAEGVRHRHVSAFDDPETLAWLEDEAPDLGVVAGTHILPPSVFDLPRLGSVNLHCGKVPEYRGAAPGFWELYHAEDQVGVTVHEVTEELDAGRVVRQETLPLDPVPSGDPVSYLEDVRSRILIPHGVHLLAEAVRDIARGEADPVPQEKGAAVTHPAPTRRHLRRLRWKVRRRRAGRTGGHLLGRLAFATGLHRGALRDRAAVVLFHRVVARDDENVLTCPQELFADYCRFFRRNFDVISLGELLRRLDRGEDLSGCLVITFDDGYLDNYTLARPVLEDHGLPACFFLATGLVETDRVTWWDGRLGEAPAWMTWKQAADLVERGFEVGGHTRNHVDLGSVDGSRARREIRGSRRDIAEKIGVETPFFSYPYGGPGHLTEANRRKVREAGYACCLSAHGGVVRPGTSPFHLPRRPVSDWYVSPHHFGVQLLREARAEG